ncbi:MAG TPA: MarR family transcriptional regulator [Humibacillus xanthopallidus]|nr:MarR family transcriptional regulator [Humibacillus xanthopallidus]
MTETPSVGVLMFVAYRAMEQQIYAEVVAAGFEATLPQARLFARISEQGLRLTDLAESAQVTKQTAAYLVEQLESLGYVERVPHPTDARARLVRLAPRGRETQALASSIEARIEREWQAHLGAAEWARLHASLIRLREITDPYLGS